MRMWHIDMLDVLPNKQLVSQWRECAAIAGAISKNQTPNHMLVNKVLDYHWYDFIEYTECVMEEMINRGYKPTKGIMDKIRNFCEQVGWLAILDNNNIKSLYEGWHNPRYLKQCLYNLQEKYDCGGISSSEWEQIQNKYSDIIK